MRNKIFPVESFGREEENAAFDDVIGRSYNTTGGSKRKKLKSKKKKPKSVDTAESIEKSRIECNYRTLSSLIRSTEYFKALKHLWWKSKKGDIELISVSVGLFTVFITEIYSKSCSYGRYNAITLIMLAGALHYPHFPGRTIRPHVVIFFITVLSIVSDVLGISHIVYDPTTTAYNPAKTNGTVLIITALCIISLCKTMLLWVFLSNSLGSTNQRLRKYLHRRVRLFLIPFTHPRRIMRDVRARILAIGWLELAACLSYFSMAITLVFYFDYSAVFMDPNDIKKTPDSLVLFLIVKTLSSLTVLLWVLYDTDLVLCLWYFGCLGCSVQYVRSYIKRKRTELKGFPLAYSYYKTRYYILVFLKFLDSCIGIYGWVVLSYVFGYNFTTLQLRLQFLIGFVTLCMVVTDLYCPVLLCCIQWLLHRRWVLKKLNEQVDSDDSELDEFELRSTTLPDDEASDYDEEEAGMESELQTLLKEQRKLTYYKKHRDGLHQPRLSNTIHPLPSEEYESAEAVNAFKSMRKSTFNTRYTSIGTDGDGEEEEEESTSPLHSPVTSSRTLSKQSSAPPPTKGLPPPSSSSASPSTTVPTSSISRKPWSKPPPPREPPPDSLLDISVRAPVRVKPPPQDDEYNHPLPQNEYRAKPRSLQGVYSIGGDEADDAFDDDDEARAIVQASAGREFHSKVGSSGALDTFDPFESGAKKKWDRLERFDRMVVEEEKAEEELRNQRGAKEWEKTQQILRRQREKGGERAREKEEADVERTPLTDT